jgi:gliding motility-associated protein GldE
VTGLLLLFGEIMPKVYAKINNVRLARFMAKPLHFLMQVFRPFIFALVNWTNLIENRIFQVTPPGSITSKEDIDEAINLTVSHEINSSKEVDLLRSILKFGEVSVKQIMQPRVDVVAVDNKTNYEDLLEVIKSSGYSRIPVYQNDFDNVIGILYAKDLIGKLNESPDFNWTSLIRTNVLYVPEAKKISDLLKRFQKERLHMAIVVDEYGGSAGIVTLEDIMEEVIGDIRDEFDDGVEVDYIKLDDQTYIFDGKTLLNDVCRVLNIDTNSFDLIKGEADSLAGMLLEINGSFPKKDAEITYNQFKFTVANITNRRIAKVKLKLL